MICRAASVRETTCNLLQSCCISRSYSASDDADTTDTREESSHDDDDPEPDRYHAPSLCFAMSVLIVSAALTLGAVGANVAYQSAVAQHTATFA